ncbi:unnamed protein product, partial [marine sediment metagenome]
LGYYEEDTWYPVDIEWDSDAGKVRAKFNNGDWTDWENQAGPGIPGKIRLVHMKNGTNWGDFYIDYIAETSFIPICSLERCDLCEEWFECQVVGCCWYYEPW